MPPELHPQRHGASYSCTILQVACDFCMLFLKVGCKMHNTRMQICNLALHGRSHFARSSLMLSTETAMLLKLPDRTSDVTQPLRRSWRKVECSADSMRSLLLYYKIGKAGPSGSRQTKHAHV